MATQTSLFDLYYVLVEVLFGNELTAGIGVAVVLFLIGMICRMSALSSLYIAGLFLLAIGMASSGGGIAFLGFIFAGGIFAYSTIKFFYNR